MSHINPPSKAQDWQNSCADRNSTRLVTHANVHCIAIMSDSAATQISQENRRRHAHNTTQERCKYCKSYIATPEGTGRITYVCGACGRAILEFRPQKQANSAD